LRRLAAVLFASSVLVVGCTTNQSSSDPLQVAATLEAAKPAVSPAQSVDLRGQVLPLTGPASALALDPSSATVAVAIDQPASVLLYALNDLTAAPRSVPLPGPAARLSVSDGKVEAAVPGSNQLVEIALPAGTATPRHVDGGPSDTTSVGNRTLITQREAKKLSVLEGDQVKHTINGLTSPDQVLAVGDHAVMLDRLRSAVFDVDPNSETLGAGLRAGNGAVNAVTDRFGRVLVTDARDGELMAFSVNPVIMRQRYPVPGTPYGLAYDSKRDLAWVTLTERNEVVGFAVAGGEPVEKYRFATVRQPNSVAVDPGSGRVFVASADQGGMQVIQP
jgi:hypothetical protein